MSTPLTNTPLRSSPLFRYDRHSMNGDWNILITSYEVLRSDVQKLQNLKFDIIALDEGHLLKNPNTNTARAARVLDCNLRVILSGTPVQNNVNELWSCFDFLMEGFLGTREEFGKKYGNVIMESVAGCVMSTEGENNVLITTLVTRSR